MPTNADLPRWLHIVNRIVIRLQRLGLSLGTMHVLSVPGRVSGAMRSTPVSLLTVDGQRYIVAGLDNADWVRNARAARQGILRYGRRNEPVELYELSISERPAILREFPRLVPGGVQFFTRLYGIAAEPEAFAGLAPHCPVIRATPRQAAEAEIQETLAAASASWPSHAVRSSAYSTSPCSVPGSGSSNSK